MKSSFERRSVEVFTNDRTTTASTTRGREPGPAPRQPRPNRLCRTKLVDGTPRNKKATFTEQRSSASDQFCFGISSPLSQPRPNMWSIASKEDCQKTSTARKHAGNMPYSSVTVSGVHLNCVSSFAPVRGRPLSYCHSKSGKKSMP